MDFASGTVGMSGAFGSRITLTCVRGAAHRSVEWRARPAFRSYRRRKTLHSYHQCPSALAVAAEKNMSITLQNIYQLTRFEQVPVGRVS